MAYTKQTWTDGVSKLNATRMQHIEDGLETAAAAVDPADGAADELPVADGAGAVTWEKIGNAQVATNAAIAYSKLNLTSSIVNADIAAAAAIGLSKLSGYPSDSAKFAGGSGTWQTTATGTYVPTLTGSVSNPTLGSGNTQNGRYVQFGKLVIGTFRVNLGGAGFVNGSGTLRVSLPVTALAAYAGTFLPVGSGWIFDSSATTIAGVEIDLTDSTKMVLRSDQAAVAVTYAAPWTFGQSDEVTGHFLYEAA